MSVKTSTSNYQPGQSIEHVQKKYGLKGVIKLASNENPFGPSKKATDKVNKLISNVNRYPDGSCIQLKKTIKKFLSKSYIGLDNITVGNGSNEILELVARTYLSADSESLFSKHSFIVYKIISNSMKAKIIESKPITKKGADYLGTDLIDMKSKITKKTNVIFIANPNNPTGTVVDFKELEEFIKSVPKRIIIVIDEAYYEYSSYEGHKDAISLIKKYPNVIITRSFSKIYALAGLRIGYGLASNNITQKINDKRQPFNVNYIAQSMAAISLNDKKFVNKSLRENAAARKWLMNQLKKLNIDCLDSNTNFLTINLGSNANFVFQKLLSLGVILRPLQNYGLKNYLRVTIGKKTECNTFIKKLKKVLSLIK